VSMPVYTWHMSHSLILGQGRQRKILDREAISKVYAYYALNIDARWFDVVFSGPDKTHEIIGANKSYRSGISGVISRTVTMKTTGGKFRIVVYRGERVKYVQELIDLEVGHKQLC
jgi:hypothetical protein